MIGGSAVFQDRIWILGGGTYDTPRINSRKMFGDVWSTSDGVNWELHTRCGAVGPSPVSRRWRVGRKAVGDGGVFSRGGPSFDGRGDGKLEPERRVVQL